MMDTERERETSIRTECAARPARPSIATSRADDGRSVRVDLAVLEGECRSAIVERPRDASPPMVAVSADALLAVAVFARALSRGLREAKTAGEVANWVDYATRGPSVGGDGVEDAAGSVVWRVHSSLLRAVEASETMVHRMEGPPGWRCACGLTFAEYEALNEHVRSAVRCPSCGSSAVSPGWMRPGDLFRWTCGHWIAMDGDGEVLGERLAPG